MKAQPEARSKDVSSSISLANPKEKGEKIRFLKQQIKAQAEARSQEASSSMSLANP